MFTLFHVIILAGMLFGAILGVQVGFALFGAVGALVGVSLGTIVGFATGNIPKLLVVWLVKRQLAGISTIQLREYLHSSSCIAPNVLLLELRFRGEDILQELPVVLDMLVSEDFVVRSRGWAAITSAFPELVEKIGEYRIGDSVDDCRRKTSILRNVL